MIRLNSIKKTFKILLLSVIIIFTSNSCCEPPKLASVSVNLFPQHTNCWCWAACTEMVSDYYGHRIPQHESANFVHGTNCTSDCPGACPCWDFYGASLQQIKDNWTHWNFKYKYKSSELEWGKSSNKYWIWESEDYVKETISSGRYCEKCPIYTIWWWYPVGWNGGHVVVAYGYVEIGEQQYISYLDPWAPDCEEDLTDSTCVSTPGGNDVVTTYQAFVDDNMHKWGNTFYDFEYTGE